MLYASLATSYLEKECPYAVMMMMMMIFSLPRPLSVDVVYGTSTGIV